MYAILSFIISFEIWDMSADVAIVSVFTYILPVFLQFLLYYADLNNPTWYIY